MGPNWSRIDRKGTFDGKKLLVLQHFGLRQRGAIKLCTASISGERVSGLL